MRPIELEIEAFGPFAKVQTIDFRLLKDANMFLIHGATGGGKTTILDAICYALYGVTSGDERDARAMRSDFAKDDQLTQVKLTFKVGQVTYYVHRIPAQQRPKIVGHGYTEQLPEAELYIVDGKEKKQIAVNVSRVTEKVIEIIGFDADQFRQVIMIPQGQFRKLLVAKSEERQKILGEIFQTRKYKQVEDKIREAEGKLRREVASLKERRLEQIKNIKYRPDTLLESLMESDNIDPHQVMTQVKALGQTQDEEIEKLAKGIEQSNKKLEKMAGMITVAINNNEKLNENVKAEKRYHELQANSELYKSKEKDYSLARKALPLKAKETYIKDLAGQKEQTREEVKQIQKGIKALERQYKTAKDQVEACAKKEPEIQKLTIDLNTAVENHRPKLAKLIELEKEKGLIKEEIAQAEKQQQKLKKEKEEIDKNILTAEKNLETRQALNDSLRKQALNLEKLSTTITQKKQLETLEKNHKELQNQYKIIDAGLKKVTGEYAKASAAHNQAIQQWVHAQAGELAKQLEKDEECPVCGSTTHPSPADVSSETVTQEEVEKKKALFEKADKKRSKYQQQHASIQTEGKESKQQILAQKELLGKYSEDSLEDLQKKEKKLKSEKEESIKSLDKLVKLEKTILDDKKKKGQLDEQITKLQEKDKENADKFTSLKTQIGQIKKEIPALLIDQNKLEQYIKAIENAIKAHTQVADQAKQDLEEVTSRKIQAETKAKEKATQVKNITIRYEKELADFKAERESLGFKTLVDYQKAYKSQEELERLEKEIKAYRNLYSIAKAQYEQLKEETKAIKLVDIEALRQKRDELEQARDKQSRAHQTIIVEKEHNEHQVATILKSSQTIADKEKKYSIVGDLTKAVRGHNVKGLSFERFIQSSLFEDVLIRANERLTLMSNTRYELYRSDDRETKAAHAGLDLEVLDTYTGKKRHVRTLSGGEGFMASLSLALGLADVVQSYAGGISLDTIFIDEGFGTLDVESLDAAIETLINLQQSGRLVGIISHVPELRDRIGARLEVMTTQSGSEAKFHII